MELIITLIVTMIALQSDNLKIQIVMMLFIIAMLLIEMIYLIFKFRRIENENRRHRKSRYKFGV